MKFCYTIYRADGTEEQGEVDWPEHPSYVQIKTLTEPIVGGPLEHVTVLHDGERADMFVDELGHMRKSGPKPRNEKGTTIYRNNWLTRHPEAEPESLPHIVGDVVLFHRVVWT